MQDDAPTPLPTGTEVARQEVLATGSVVISLVDDRLDPSWIEIAVGTTVTWVNKGADWQNVASSTAGFASEKILPGKCFSFTLEEPGEYKIVCRHHGLAGMTATILVS